MVGTTIYLVSCVGQKGPQQVAAKDLYQSAWFKKARAYVEATGCSWFILSAEYGLVHPETVIEPYERTLNTMRVTARREWATKVAKRLREELGYVDRFVVFAGARYREFLMPVLQEVADSVEVPMKGMRIGEQLRWLGGYEPA